MSKQRKGLHQRPKRDEDSIRAARARQLRSVDQSPVRMDGPDDVVSYTHVHVLLKGDWSLLYAALERADIAEPDVVAMDRLVTHAALALAARALAAHIQDHQSLYSRAGVADLQIGLPDERLLCAATVWGDTDAASLRTNVQSAVANAQQARAADKATPKVFWPVVGGFYSAPDAQPEPAPATWSDLMVHPEQYALVPLRVTARFVDAASNHGRGTIGSERHGKTDWWFCRRCGRCYQGGERRIVAGRTMCPYLDCQGDVGHDAMNWEAARLLNGDLPKRPSTGTVYPR